MSQTDHLLAANDRYAETFDNVRFIGLGGGACAGPGCGVATGFDPQKGPMTTQSLRGMLEPLHWRGDQPTMAGFNSAFVTLLGYEPEDDAERFV